jgi:4-hydroxy-tetrahydrodipicolinate synthase
MPETKILLASKRIRGVLAPVVTPFKADLAPDRQRFITHCRWLLSQNCGLAPFGTTSEANSMSTDERISLLDALVAAGIDPSRMMPGTGCCSITETVALTAHAVKHGCAGVLMLPPFYYKDVSEGLYRYFSEVVQRVSDACLRIYLYHIPPVAVVGITPKLVERLLKAYPSAIAGMKDSSGDWNNTKTFLDAFSVRTRHERSSKSQTSSSKSQGSSKIQPSKGEGTFGSRRGGDFDNQTSFDVFVGSESFLLANMRNGGTGTISATANVNPAAIDALYQSAKTQAPNPKHQENSKHQTPEQHRAGALQPRQENESNIEHRTSKMERQQADLDVVREVFSSRKFPSMIAAVKQAIAIYANDPEWTRVRPPLVELTTAQAKLLAEQLGAIGFTMNGIKERLIRKPGNEESDLRDRTRATGNRAGRRQRS